MIDYCIKYDPSSENWTMTEIGSLTTFINDVLCRFVLDTINMIQVP